MNQVTVKCPSCTLSKTFDSTGIIPPDWKNEAGELVCPNCDQPMKPLGASDTLPAAEAVADATKQLREGQATSAPVETEETLRKRLAEIRSAELEVRRALSKWKATQDAAKEARKTYDGAVSTLLAVSDRMTRVASGEELPLFTKAAEVAAAAPSEPGPDHPSAVDEVLLTTLTEAGAAVSGDDLAEWTPAQRLEAYAWATREGTVDTMPDWLALLSHESVEEPEPAIT